MRNNLRAISQAQINGGDYHGESDLQIVINPEKYEELREYIASLLMKEPSQFDCVEATKVINFIANIFTYVINDKNFSIPNETATKLLMLSQALHANLVDRRIARLHQEAMNNYPADLANFRYHRLFGLLHDENSDSSIKLELESLFSNEQVTIKLLQKKIQALEKHSSRFFLWRSFSWLINYDNIYHDAVLLQALLWSQPNLPQQVQQQLTPLHTDKLSALLQLTKPTPSLLSRLIKAWRALFSESHNAQQAERNSAPPSFSEPKESSNSHNPNAATPPQAAPFFAQPTTHFNHQHRPSDKKKQSPAPEFISNSVLSHSKAELDMAFIIDSWEQAKLLRMLDLKQSAGDEITARDIMHAYDSHNNSIDDGKQKQYKDAYYQLGKWCENKILQQQKEGGEKKQQSQRSSNHNHQAIVRLRKKASSAKSERQPEESLRQPPSESINSSSGIAVGFRQKRLLSQLGIEKSIGELVSQSEIKKAYIQKAKQHHPDKQKQYKDAYYQLGKWCENKILQQQKVNGEKKQQSQHSSNHNHQVTVKPSKKVSSAKSERQLEESLQQLPLVSTNSNSSARPESKQLGIAVGFRQKRLLSQLGIEKSIGELVSQSEIKKACIQKAKQHHSSKQGKKEDFQQCASAYHALRDWWVDKGERKQGGTHFYSHSPRYEAWVDNICQKYRDLLKDKGKETGKEKDNEETKLLKQEVELQKQEFELQKQEFEHQRCRYNNLEAMMFEVLSRLAQTPANPNPRAQII